MKPKILDLFCGAGGASAGYAAAGFDVLGVDLAAQPNYPYEFVQADALWILDHMNLDLFDAIHASPPCQRYCAMGNTNRQLGRDYSHPDLIAAVRERLQRIGKPYVIENVVGSPLINPIRLCGTSFDLPLRRHRLFECSFPVTAPACAHHKFTEPRYWTGWTQGGRTQGNKRRATTVQVYGNAGEKHLWPEAMGIHWMNHRELAQAIPPMYTTHIGLALARTFRKAAA